MKSVMKNAHYVELKSVNNARRRALLSFRVRHVGAWTAVRGEAAAFRDRVRRCCLSNLVDARSSARGHTLSVQS